jgi:hypothetical protein
MLNCRNVNVLFFVVSACQNTREVQTKREAPATRAESPSANERSASSVQESTKNLHASVPRLECTEYGQETPPAEIPPGIPSFRWVTQTLANLPPGLIAYEADGYVRLVTTDGRRRIKLGLGRRPQWFPDGTHIGFVSTQAGLPPRLVKASADCGFVRVLTEWSQVQETASLAASIKYAISPSGAFAALTRDVNGGNTSLFLIDIATGVERKLLEGVTSVEPAWSPDGRMVVVSRPGDSASQFVRIDVSNGQSLVIGEAYFPTFTFTKDGRFLYQSLTRDSFAVEDRVSHFYWSTLEQPHRPILLQGSGLAPGLYGEIRPSPNGKWVASSWSLWTGNGPAAVRDHGLCVYSTSEQTKRSTLEKEDKSRHTNASIVFLRPRATSYSLRTGPQNELGDPSWAPDSQHLVVDLTTCGVQSGECLGRLVAIDVTTTNPEVTFLANGTAPEWQPTIQAQGSP